MYRVIATPKSFEIFNEVADECLLRLTNGHTLLIAQTWATISAQDERRAQDFAHGILLAMTHIAATGKVPAITMEIPHGTE